VTTFPREHGRAGAASPVMVTEVAVRRRLSIGQIRDSLVPRQTLPFVKRGILAGLLPAGRFRRLAEVADIEDGAVVVGCEGSCEALDLEKDVVESGGIELGSGEALFTEELAVGCSSFCNTVSDD
jgi:hypothetical protein